MEKREKFSSRLGFILVSAGCAVGLGNVWKFPYMCGQYGGAAFIAIYLVFLVILGYPIIVCEFAVGRGSQKSCATSFRKLEPKGRRWHYNGYIGMAGCYLLMMYYTMVTGWMLYYAFRYITGALDASSTETTAAAFSQMLGSPGIMVLFAAIVTLLCIGVCALGLQNGIEKITKVMMLLLMGLMVVLAVNSIRLKGASAGLKFYLVPDFRRIAEIGFGSVLFAAMTQAFFTLSVGMGSMMIFGSYIGKERALVGEGIQITLLDTFVAIMSGVIIFPACMSYNIPTDSGPSLIFVTLPKVFEHMSGGRFWGAMFFLFMTFAALSTVIAVLENIIACNMEAFGWSRKKAGIINLFIIIVMSIPCILGFNVLIGFTPLGAGTNVLDLEDFLVSSLILPIGSLVILLFCTTKLGWGYDNYMNEVNNGKGIGMPKIFKFYLKYILPLVILFIIIDGLI